MEILNFGCYKNLNECVDSMLFDSDIMIASMECKIGNHNIVVTLMTRGSVKVEYKENVYRYPSDFPDELKAKIKNNPNWWDDDEDIYIDENNWFEYIYDHRYKGETYSDGIMCEGDISKYSIEDLKKEMMDICKWIVDAREEYVPSAENGDYGPSNPWDAPGMSVKDFI